MIKFYWTARLIENHQIKASRYFLTKKERDEFVINHSDWKKRGKICAENLDKHLEKEQQQ